MTSSLGKEILLKTERAEFDTKCAEVTDYWPDMWHNFQKVWLKDKTHNVNPVEYENGFVIC